MIFYATEGLAYSMGTEKTQIYTLRHLNLHSIGSNLTLWDPMVLEAKLIPPLTLPTGTTMMTIESTLNLVAQTAPVMSLQALYTQNSWIFLAN